jgi:D-cysteine desulfhydrase
MTAGAAAATAGASALPRVRLAQLPTPLQSAPRLSEALGLEVWLKRDDLTGFGLGGNKVRALEYLLADARHRGADCLVTGGGPQSNWAALAALAARRCGLEPHLVAYGGPRPITGNLTLAELAGAELRFTGDPDRSSVDHGVAMLGEELRAAGRHPCLLPRGGATPLGTVGYVEATRELSGQLDAAAVAPAQVWLATGSCGTQAGLVAGYRRLGLAWEVVGVTVSRPVQECLERVATLAARAAVLLGGSDPSPRYDDIVVLGGHLGPGYGLPSPTGERAARLTAQTEGVVLDPVFGAKAMGALMEAARAGRCPGPVVFLVTGGAPTLFAGGR